VKDRRRPSLLYVVPGHVFMPSAGPTRNVLNQARAMAAWADVAVAFRSLTATPGPTDPRIVAIDPGSGSTGTDDAATRGMGYLEFAAYLRRIRRFMFERLDTLDVVLEKDWMLTGYVARWCRRRRVPCLPVKNWVAGGGPSSQQGLAKRLRAAVASELEGRLLRRAPAIVVETEFLKSAAVSRWNLEPGRIDVIGLGVDRELFRPMDRTRARADLELPASGRMLLYAGILDRTHDLRPLLEALCRVQDRELCLHVVGDGPCRQEYEELASAAPGAVHFHGRVPHGDVPLYVAASDLCVAPYDTRAFPGGEVGYSTLKVREYLSAGRPVATTGSGSLRDLVREDVTGFLLDNEPDRWYELLASRRTWDRLASMAEAASATDLPSWDDVARRFQHVCMREISSFGGRCSSPAEVLPCEAPGG